jgi:hypothetical protein
MNVRTASVAFETTIIGGPGIVSRVSCQRLARGSPGEDVVSAVLKPRFGDFDAAGPEPPQYLGRRGGDLPRLLETDH